MKCSKKTLALILPVLLILCIGAVALGVAGAGQDTDGSAAAIFSDVPAGADYAPAVAWCFDQGLMNGTGEAAFSPDATLTRAMVATVLYRAAGEPAVDGAPAFDDTEAGTWYSNAVVWANQSGIVRGYGNGLFGTEDPITQEQLDILVRRYKGEDPTWTGDPALNAPATRAQAAVAFYNNLRGGTPGANISNGGAAITLNMNGTPIHAKLYDNSAAKAFLELLPYTVTVSRATDDLCGTVSGDLAHDPAEDQDTWAIGEIGWFDGWFTILCDNEAGMPHRTRTIIGKVDEADIPTMQALRGSVKIEITLDESLSNPSAGGAEAPTVYFTSDISPEGLMAVYETLDWQPTGKVAVKLSTGEIPNSNYLRPELIKDLVQFVDGTIVECNTAYRGGRSETTMHYQVAKDHGFTDIAPFQILDEDGSMTLTVNGGSVLKENYVGKAFADYDSYLILSHFKGHQMAGYGGAIKNISIGIGSSQGKAWIHSGGTSLTSTWGEQDAFLEAMAEAGKSVSDYLGNGDRIVYVNVMNRLSIDCDCNGRPAEPDMHDIGILASTDPVALDQACLDLIYAQKDGDGASLVRRIESLNGLHTLEHAEEIGLGSREYNLVSIDG